MGSYSGILRKMKSEWAEPVQYSLRLGEAAIPLNPHIGQPIRLEFTGSIFCVQCGRKTSKSFQQGFCFPCYRRLLECNLCTIHPERCRVETGGCPAGDWAHASCSVVHIVYLANASGAKVGITRESQVPTRWIDQGAIQAVPIIRVGNRYRAGRVEVAFKSFVADKTNWRLMLKNQIVPLDLLALRDQLFLQAQDRLQAVADEVQEPLEFLDLPPTDIHYPVLQYPTKIHSFSLDREAVIEGALWGIKGQYLLLDQWVINLRKFSGYEVCVTL